MDIATKAYNSTAEYSACAGHRYTLVRHFYVGEAVLNFILLNPSTATEKFNDPTIARCETYALRHGYRTLVITNIFSWRDTSPKGMMEKAKAGTAVAGDPENIAYIVKHAENADTVICGWGNHGQFQNRSTYVESELDARRIILSCLAHNKSGEPKHPLYIAGNQAFRPLRP